MNNINEYRQKQTYNLDSISVATMFEYVEKGGIAGDKAFKLLYVNNAVYNLETVHKPSEYITPRSAKISIGDNSANPSFAIYPNPAKDYLTIDYKLIEQKGTIQIVITDLSGKLVYNQDLHSLEDMVLIKLDNLLPGTYICSLFNGNDCDFSEKFVINK